MFHRDSMCNVYEYEHKYKRLVLESNRKYCKYDDIIEALENKNKELEKELEKLKEQISKLETALLNK